MALVVPIGVTYSGKSLIFEANHVGGNSFRVLSAKYTPLLLSVVLQYPRAFFVFFGRPLGGLDVLLGNSFGFGAGDGAPVRELFHLFLSSWKCLCLLWPRWWKHIVCLNICLCLRKRSMQIRSSARIVWDSLTIQVTLGDSMDFLKVFWPIPHTFPYVHRSEGFSV